MRIDIVGKKFVLKNGRMGKVIRQTKKYIGDGIFAVGYNIRAVGNTKLRNIYSYFVRADYFNQYKAVFVESYQIQIMYRVIEHYDKNGWICRPHLSIKSKRVVKYL